MKRGNKTGGGALVSKYAYEHDSRTRRTRKKMTGTTLFGTNGKRNVYGYNDDDEIDEADRYNHATSGGTLADDWTYSFDGIGNRLSAVGQLMDRKECMYRCPKYGLIYRYFPNGHT